MTEGPPSGHAESSTAQRYHQYGQQYPVSAPYNTQPYNQPYLQTPSAYTWSIPGYQPPPIPTTGYMQQRKPPTPTPSPSPPPEIYLHWDEALKAFLTRIGFSQALRGFEADMLVMNPKFEADTVPSAIKNLTTNLQVRLTTLLLAKRLKDKNRTSVTKRDL